MGNEIDKDYSALIEDYEDALMRLAEPLRKTEYGQYLLKVAEEGK